MTAERKTDQELVRELRSAAINEGAQYMRQQGLGIVESDYKAAQTQNDAARDALLTRLSELRAENERQRKALEAVAPYFEGEHGHDHPDVLTIRAALTTPTEDQGNG